MLSILYIKNQNKGRVSFVLEYSISIEYKEALDVETCEVEVRVHFVRVILRSQTTIFHLPFPPPHISPISQRYLTLLLPFPLHWLSYVDRLNTLALGTWLYTFFDSPFSVRFTTFLDLRQ